MCNFSIKKSLGHLFLKRKYTVSTSSSSKSAWPPVGNVFLCPSQRSVLSYVLRREPSDRECYGNSCCNREYAQEHNKERSSVRGEGGDQWHTTKSTISGSCLYSRFYWTFYTTLYKSAGICLLPQTDASSLKKVLQFMFHSPVSNPPSSTLCHLPNVLIWIDFYFSNDWSVNFSVSLVCIRTTATWSGKNWKL